MAGLTANERKLPKFTMNGMALDFYLILGGTDSGQIVYRDVLDKGTQSFLIQAHGASITQIVTNNTGTKIVTSSTDGFVKLWLICYTECEASEKHLKGVLSPNGKRIKMSLQQVAMFSIGNNICDLMVHEDSTHLFGMALKNRRVVGFRSTDNGSTYQFIPSHPDDENHTGHISGIAYLESLGIFATSSYDGNVKVWDLATNQMIRDIQFSEQLDSVEFASDRGDLIVAMTHQIVLVQTQDYLPLDYLPKLLEKEWVDDAIEDPDILDLNSGFWKRTKFQRRIVDEYPILWNQLMLRLNIDSWERQKSVRATPEKEISRKSSREKKTRLSTLEERINYYPTALKYNIEVLEEEPSEEVDPTKVNIPDYQYHEAEGRRKTRIYDELEKDGPINYNVPEMELEKILQNALNKPTTPTFNWKESDSKSESDISDSSNQELRKFSVLPPISSNEQNRQLRQEVVDMIEYNKKQKELVKAKLEEEQRKLQLEQLEKTRDIPRPNAAGQQSPVVVMGVKRFSLMQEHHSAPRMGTTKSRRTSLMSFAEDSEGIMDETFNSDEENGSCDELDRDEWEMTDSGLEPSKKGRNKKKATKDKKKASKLNKKAIKESLDEESDIPDPSLPHHPGTMSTKKRLSVISAPYTETLGFRSIQYYMLPMIIQPKIEPPLQSFTNENIRFSDSILDKNSYFVKNQLNFDVPGVRVKTKTALKPLAARQLRQDFRKLLGDIKPAPKKKLIKVKKQKEKSNSSIHSGTIDLSHVNLEVSDEEDEYIEVTDEDDMEDLDEYEYGSKPNIAKFDAATVAWSLFKAAMLQNQGVREDFVQNSGMPDSVYKMDQSFEMKNPKYKPVLPTALYLEKLKKPAKRDVKGKVTLCIPDVKRIIENQDKGVDSLGMDLFNRLQKNLMLEDTDESSDDDISEEITFGLISRRQSMKPMAISETQGEQKTKASRKSSLAHALPPLHESIPLEHEEPILEGLVKKKAAYEQSESVTSKSNLLSVPAPANSVHKELPTEPIEVGETCDTQVSISPKVSSEAVLQGATESQSSALPLMEGPIQTAGAIHSMESLKDPVIQLSHPEILVRPETRDGVITKVAPEKPTTKFLSASANHDKAELKSPVLLKLKQAEKKRGSLLKDATGPPARKSLDEVLKSSTLLPIPKPKAMDRAEAIQFSKAPPSKLGIIQPSTTQLRDTRRGAIFVQPNHSIGSTSEYPNSSQESGTSIQIESKRMSLFATSKPQAPGDIIPLVDPAVGVLTQASWFPDFKGKEVTLHSIVEAILTVIQENQDEAGRIEATLCLRFLMDTFESEIANIKSRIVDGILDAIHAASPLLKVELVKLIGDMNVATESVIVSLICALNDSSDKVVRAAIDALGYLGISTTEELYYRMKQVNILQDFKKSQFVHPLDVL